ncbi:hypothetical protein NFI96_025557 [Prochilodus magdalenae]|nr:hypothetical protein NFI96_025557 [Prochilodus magdalenae]
MEEPARGLAELLLDGELEAVTLGLEKGLFSWDELDLPHSPDGSTPLISACQMGRITVMRFLLDRGADTTLCNHNNQTALHVSPPHLQGELLTTTERPLCQEGQLLEAAWRGDVSALQHLLLEHPHTVPADGAVGMECPDADVNSQNRDGLTALMLAVRDVDLFEGLQDAMPWNYSPAETVKALLALSASREIQDQRGYTALHYASRTRSPIKDELLQTILTPQLGETQFPLRLPTRVEIQVYFPAGCSRNSLSRSAPPPATVKLEHPHTVPADGAVGLEVEEHQAFWTRDDKPFISVLTTVPPHTDSLGVSTKTKAGLETEQESHKDYNPAPGIRPANGNAPYDEEIWQSPVFYSYANDPHCPAVTSCVCVFADKIITLFFPSAMEPERTSRRGSAQLGKATGCTSSLPNLRDRNKCWDKLGTLQCTSDVPIKTALIPIPPRLTERRKTLLVSPLAPQVSQLSQSAPGLALLDPGVLLQVRANIYNSEYRGPPPVLCPRIPKHLAPLDRESRDGPMVSSLQRPLLLKPISILPASSLSRPRRERFSRRSLRGSRGTRRGSAESASSSCSGESSLDGEEEEEIGPQQMFSTLKEDLQDPPVSPASSGGLLNKLIDMVHCVKQDVLIKSHEAEAEMRHASVNDCKQNGERCSAFLLKQDKLVEAVESSIAGKGAEDRPAVNNGPSGSEHQHLSPEGLPVPAEKRKSMKAAKSKERKCRPFQTSQSFNILAYRNVTWGTVIPKRNRRNSSLSPPDQSKDMNPKGHITGVTPDRLDWPRPAPASSQKVRDAPLTRRRVQDFPNQVKLSGDRKISDKCQGLKQLPSREPKTARPSKKPGHLGIQRAKSVLDSVSYSDMFSQIHQGDKGPAIFEMFATPLYENLRVGSSAERTKQVQPAPQVKRPLKGPKAQKAVEGTRRNQPQKRLSKGKPRKRRDPQQIRPPSLQSAEAKKDEAVPGLGYHDIPSSEEENQNVCCVNERSPVLSVIKEVLSNCATATPIDHEQRDFPTLSPDAYKETCSSKLKDSVEREFKVEPMINTWTSGRTRSPVYQRFLDEVGEGPVTDDLLRCLAEELISLEEREVETLKPEHTANGEIMIQQPEFKKDLIKVTLSSNKPPCVQKSSMDDTITWTRGEVLGKGAYGTVYCGLTGQGQLIAVKQVVLDVSSSETAEKEYGRLEREVDLLKNLNHPNIVGFLGTAPLLVSPPRPPRKLAAANAAQFT